MNSLYECRIVRRAVLFGKSYMWLRTRDGLELYPDYAQRTLFPRGERRQMEHYRRTGFTR